MFSTPAYAIDTMFFSLNPSSCQCHSKIQTMKIFSFFRHQSSSLIPIIFHIYSSDKRWHFLSSESLETKWVWIECTKLFSTVQNSSIHHQSTSPNFTAESWRFRWMSVKNCRIYTILKCIWAWYRSNVHQNQRLHQRLFVSKKFVRKLSREHHTNLKFDWRWL